MSFRFVHGADLHLGAPMGLRSIPPGWEAHIEMLDRNLLDRVAAFCCAEDVDFLILAGDIFDNPHPHLRLQRSFVQAMEQLDDAGVHCFLIEGNHDAGAWDRFAFPLPARVHRFGKELGEIKIRLRSNNQEISIWGASFAVEHRERPVVDAFPDALQSDWAAVVFHAEQASQGRYHPFLHKDLAYSPFAYHALGHEHSFQQLQNPALVYPGIPQARHRAEVPASGICLVEVQGKQQQVTSVDVAAVQWRTEEIAVDGLDENGVFRRCVNLVQRCHDQHTQPVIVCLQLTGTSTDHRGWSSKARVEEFLEALREETRWLQGVWLESLEYVGWPAVDRTTLTDRDDFLGEVFRQLTNEEPLRDVDQILSHCNQELCWAAVYEEARRQLLGAFNENLDGDEGHVD